MVAVYFVSARQLMLWTNDPKPNWPVPELQGEKKMPSCAQSAWLTVERPCAFNVAVQACPVITVKWAMVTRCLCPSAGPVSGSVLNTAPLTAIRAVSGVQDPNGIPMLAKLLSELPLVIPIVRKESYSDAGCTSKKNGSIPPMLLPKGGSVWKAAGIRIGWSLSPKIVYTFCVSGDPARIASSYVV